MCFIQHSGVKHSGEAGDLKRHFEINVLATEAEMTSLELDAVIISCHLGAQATYMEH